jgi:hypothetical protein
LAGGVGFEPTTNELTITLDSSAFSGKVLNQGLWVLTHSMLYQIELPIHMRISNYTDSINYCFVASWYWFLGGGAGIEPAMLVLQTITLNSSAFTGKG